MKSQYHFKFEDLKVYKKAIDFGESINSQVENFPTHEVYKLSSQFIRAADSIALNIAEGSASSDANFMRYLKMAWDSAHECVAISTKARLRNYINFDENEENRKKITEISKMISSLIKHLKNK
ncbi:four helix bundle protein [Psychroflexus halocasei]|uniref:Four helix bundle protein n=1 Tax=Psychroflexus halocasei TaxID=908615 RepID=A0A1H4AN08_9FLAO|nr:four helix bundle protein [Psychroflexus halocasei]SEA37366.1 four helix bundle protein [Psychroflexus halocasei]